MQRPRRASRSDRPSFGSDQRLARRAAGGDLEAFATIFRRYQGDLYRFCVGIVREPRDAEDAVQETMVKAMRALPGERRELELRPWLFRIAHNEAVELRRRERTLEPSRRGTDHAVVGTEERFEQDARLRTLFADIADLPERQRATLVMRELNGLDFGEIGAVLGTSPGAARQTLYEARRGLGQMASGRDMECDDAMRQISDTDGRPHRRGVRAHLRDCTRCRRFQAEIKERRGTLAGIVPLSPLAAAAMLKEALGRTSAGSAAAGAGGGAAAGALGGSAGMSGLVKAGVGLLAVLAVGAVATHHPGRPGGPHPAEARHRAEAGRLRPPGERGRAVSAPAGQEDARAHSIAGRSADLTDLALADRIALAGRPGTPRRSAVSPEPPVPPAATPSPSEATVGLAPSTGQGDASPVAGAATSGAPGDSGGKSEGSVGSGEVDESEGGGHSEGAGKGSASTGSAAHPEHPEHPAHPAHPEHPAQSEKGNSTDVEGTGLSLPGAEGASAEESAAVPETAAAAEPPSIATESPGAASGTGNGKAKGHEKQVGGE